MEWDNNYWDFIFPLMYNHCGAKCNIFISSPKSSPNVTKVFFGALSFFSSADRTQIQVNATVGSYAITQDVLCCGSLRIENKHGVCIVFPTTLCWGQGTDRQH